jgi:hypothetical protein
MAMRYYLWGAIFACVVIALAIWGWGGANSPNVDHEPTASNMTRTITPHPKTTVPPSSDNTPENTAPTRAGGEPATTAGVNLPKSVTK